MQPLGDMPLIGWTLERCRRWFPEIPVWVATEDRATIEYAAGFGCHPFPLNADDLEDRRCVDGLFAAFLAGWPTDERCLCMQPTSPFLFRSEIERAIAHPGYYVQSGSCRIFPGPAESRLSQEIPTEEFLTGNFITGYGQGHWLKHGKSVSPVSAISALEIDTPEDLELCRWLAQNIQPEDFD